MNERNKLERNNSPRALLAIIKLQKWNTNTVKPGMSNHPGEYPKVVALRLWLLFVMRVMSQSYAHSIFIC